MNFLLRWIFPRVSISIMIPSLPVSISTAEPKYLDFYPSIQKNDDFKFHLMTFSFFAP